MGESPPDALAVYVARLYVSGGADLGAIFANVRADFRKRPPGE